jgi:polyphosphate kinase
MLSFRYELRSSAHLEELASSRLPDGVEASDAKPSQHRDIYLDTPDDTLRRRDIVCRFRLGTDDSRVLSLRIGAGANGEEVKVDSRVKSADPIEAIQENTEAGRRLRGVVNPDHLQPMLDLEVERLTRNADFNWLRRPRVEMHYDRITARHGKKSRHFHQLCIHAKGKNPGSIEHLARALERENHLRRVPVGLRDRAELLLRWKGSDDEKKEPSTAPRGVTTGGPRGASGELSEFLNPELSLLAFQSRVLALAEDARTPLAERLKFISIVSSNLDEFFMVRMAGLREKAREQREEQCDDGLTRGEQVELIEETVADLMSRQTECAKECLRELDKIGIRICRWRDLNASQHEALRAEVLEQIRPALTPMAMTLSPGHPVPHLPHLTLALAVVLREADDGKTHFAEVEIPSDAPRVLKVPETTGTLVTIEEVIRSNIDIVFPPERVADVHVFRVTRGGDLDLDEERADDLVDAVADAAGRRLTNPAVRVEVERGMPGFVRNLVIDSLGREAAAKEAGLDPADIDEVDGMLDLRFFSKIELPDDPKLHYAPFEAKTPIPEDKSVLDMIGGVDLMYHHPFDSFEGTVVKFIRDASVDPNVTTIKITLYRVGDPSEVVEALLAAARNGKRVVAFVELKARFDEVHNVAWARRLERAGGHVVSGLVGFKNHAKVALIVRRENGKLRSYAHVGTGNYNTKSGREYTDLSLFSSREALTADAADLFNALTGESLPPTGLTHGALAAPTQMVDAVIAMIDREASNARAGKEARITAKLNGLSDAAVVQSLLQASRDGVKVDLVVRGICTLRPGIPGRSDNIRVVSCVGRLLEHSRIYRFENGGAPVHYIGSADWRPRNLRHRVELLVPVIDAAQKKQLDEILSLYMEDKNGWDLQSSGDYVQRNKGGSAAQEELIGRTSSQ